MSVSSLKGGRLSTEGLQFIVLDVLGPTAGKAMLWCVLIAVTVCALAVHTAAIRLAFAMARDNNLPASSLLARCSPRFRTPVLPAVIIGILALAILVVNIRQPQIFTVVTSIGIIMIYLAYLGVTGPMLVARLRGKWEPATEGRFSLGRWGLPVNIVAVVWGAAMTINLIWAACRGLQRDRALPLVPAVGRRPLRRRDRGRRLRLLLVRPAPPHRRPRRARPGDPGRPDRFPRHPGGRQGGQAHEHRRIDYVVVGGGTAGNVVAARLSEDPDVTVCVLEAGPSDVGDDDVLKLERWMGLLESGYDWDYVVEPQASGNSFLRHARAKVLGGCSSHNSCIAFWAPAEDLDDWAAAGCTGWSAADLFPLYRRLESNDAPGDHHGRTGPVKLRTLKGEDPCGTALSEACAQAGIPTVAFNTGRTVVRGTNWFQINSDENNIRQSSSVAYLHPVMGKRPTWTSARAYGGRSWCWRGGAVSARSTWTPT